MGKLEENRWSYHWETTSNFVSNSNKKFNSGLTLELSKFPFYTLEKVILSKSEKKGTQRGNELIKIRKIRSIVLYHETSI